MSSYPFLLVKQLEGDVLRLLSYIDMLDVSTKDQQTITELKHGLIDARLEIQDYQLAETRWDQLRNAKDSKSYLSTVEKLITTNPAQVFSAVDVAHLTAYIGQIRDRLE